VSGAVTGGKREDDGPYFTNNEGIPFPDPWVDCGEICGLGY
jgi:catalase